MDTTDHVIQRQVAVMTRCDVAMADRTRFVVCVVDNFKVYPIRELLCLPLNSFVENKSTEAF